MTDDKKKYNGMEPVLNNINRCFVSFPDEIRKRNNDILHSLLDLIIPKMKLRDNLFKEMYQRTFFGGSFYDGLRIGQPDEFDIDLLLSIPKLMEPVASTSNIPGYLHVQFKEYARFMKQVDMVVRYRGLDNLIDDSQYLITTKVLKWFESVVNLALNEFERRGSEYILTVPSGVFYAKMCKGGPAFTLKVSGIIDGKNTVLDIDLVPCFVFGKEKWPQNGFRKNLVSTKTEFFVVPKPLKGTNIPNSRYWRLSFQEQERVLIDNKKTLKPSLKLLKKMRDKLDHKCIASYYLKTVMLWQTETRPAEFWNNSLSFVFMTVLKEYHTCLTNKKIPYFWYKSNNLIGAVNGETLTNISNKVKIIIEAIEKNPQDSFVVAKYLLNQQELNRLQTELAPTNHLSNQMSNLAL